MTQHSKPPKQVVSGDVGGGLPDCLSQPGTGVPQTAGGAGGPTACRRPRPGRRPGVHRVVPRRRWQRSRAGRQGGGEGAAGRHLGRDQRGTGGAARHHRWCADRGRQQRALWRVDPRGGGPDRPGRATAATPAASPPRPPPPGVATPATPASVATPATPASVATPATPASVATPAGTPGAASDGPLVQLLTALSSPTVRDAITAMLLGGAGARTVPTATGAEVPAAAVTNMLGTLSARASAEWDAIGPRPAADHLAVADYAERVDAANPEARAAWLYGQLAPPEDFDNGFDDGWEDVYDDFEAQLQALAESDDTDNAGTDDGFDDGSRRATCPLRCR